MNSEYEGIPDCDILALLNNGENNYYVELAGACDLYQDFWIYEALGVGQTRVDFWFTWGGENVRHVSLDVYVGLRPTLEAYPRRGSCFWCDPSDFWNENQAY